MKKTTKEMKEMSSYLDRLLLTQYAKMGWYIILLILSVLLLGYIIFAFVYNIKNPELTEMQMFLKMITFNW